MVLACADRIRTLMPGRDLPGPGPGEVRVRVAVSGVNPTDWQARSGVGHSKHFSGSPQHLDGAGTIDAVGVGAEDCGRVGGPDTTSVRRLVSRFTARAGS